VPASRPQSGSCAFEDNGEEAGEPAFEVITAQAHATVAAVPDGDRQHLATKLLRLADAGATHFIANTSGVTTPAEHRRTLEALGALAG
jgi:hypothetical protein